MIDCLYDCFKKWSENGSVWLFSDPHFGDHDCKIMDKNWIPIDDQIERINKHLYKNDTLVLLGDLGDPNAVRRLKGHKILIVGNHDAVGRYRDIFEEIYEGPVFIAPKILLSHEPIPGLKYCVNIHGHDHGGKSVIYFDAMGAKHMNLAANVCGWEPVNLKDIIKAGLLSKIPDIHQVAASTATTNSTKKKASAERKLNAIQTRLENISISVEERKELELQKQKATKKLNSTYKIDQKVKKVIERVNGFNPETINSTDLNNLVDCVNKINEYMNLQSLRTEYTQPLAKAKENANKMIEQIKQFSVIVDACIDHGDHYLHLKVDEVVPDDDLNLFMQHSAVLLNTKNLSEKEIKRLTNIRRKAEKLLNH